MKRAVLFALAALTFAASAQGRESCMNARAAASRAYLEAKREHDSASFRYHRMRDRFAPIVAAMNTFATSKGDLNERLAACSKNINTPFAKACEANEKLKCYRYQTLNLYVEQLSSDDAAEPVLVFKDVDRRKFFNQGMEWIVEKRRLSELPISIDDFMAEHRGWPKRPAPLQSRQDFVRTYLEARGLGDCLSTGGTLGYEYRPSERPSSGVQIGF